MLDGFRERFPHLHAVDDRATLMEDPSATILVCAAVPCDRAAIAAEAMRHGKDVLMDKPGVTSVAGLALLERTVAETGRIFSICFSERFLVPAVGAALRLIRDGAIGRVVHTRASARTGSTAPPVPPGSSTLRATAASLPTSRPTRSTNSWSSPGPPTPRIVASTVGKFDDQRAPGLEDFGEVLLRSDGATGYCRVDWFTPDGLPTWGDGRLTVVGTAGTIELRKYIDIEGRPGTDHLFLSDDTGTRHIDCSGEPWTYFADFARDCRDRTEAAMAQSHVFTVCRLALAAQAGAERIALPGGLPR